MSTVLAAVSNNEESVHDDSKTRLDLKLEASISLFAAAITADDNDGSVQIEQDADSESPVNNQPTAKGTTRSPV